MKIFKFTLVFLLGMFLSAFKGTNESFKDYNFFKVYNIKSESAELNHIEHNLLLTRNNDYKVVLTHYNCDIELHLYDDLGGLVASNIHPKTGKCYGSFKFECNSTRYYKLTIDPHNEDAEGLCKVGFRQHLTN